MLRTLTVLTIAILLFPTNSLGNPVALSSFVFDWTGFAFSTTGSLTVTGIALTRGESSSAALIQFDGSFQPPGGFSVQSKNSLQFPDWTITSAMFSYSLPEGVANAQASTNNGLLNASSSAETSGEKHRDSVSAQVSQDYVVRLFGTGSGQFVITVPYTLSVHCDGTTSPRAFDVSAGSGFMAFIGPGNFGPQGSWADSISCLNQDVAFTKSGVMSLSKGVSSPNGDLTTVFVQARTSATTSIAEPSSLALLFIGIFAAPFLRRHKPFLRR
jgi:hypothetical protein